MRPASDGHALQLELAAVQADVDLDVVRARAVAVAGDRGDGAERERLNVGELVADDGPEHGHDEAHGRTIRSGMSAGVRHL